MLNPETLNLRHLRAFVEVCHEGGISAASHRIHLSQPAITQAIAKLESLLGCPLFVRSSKGMFPTAAARVFLNRCERAFDLLRNGAKSAGRKQRVSVPSTFVDLITSTQLRALIAVSEHGNFSVAARALGVSQPSVYRMARDIENLSKLQLYVKTQQGIALTPAAQILLRNAMLAFSELGQGIEELRTANGLDTSTISIGSLPLSRSTVLPLAINQLTHEHPNVRVKIIDSPYADLIHALRHGKVDFMIGSLRQMPPAPDVEQQKLFNDCLGIFCRPDHPLTRKRTISDADLASFPWVIPRKSTPTRTYFDQRFGQTVGQESEGIVETSSMILVRGLLIGSDKLTMISANQVSDDLKLGTLSELQFELDHQPRPIGLTIRKGWTPTETQSRLLDLIRSICAENWN